MIQQQEEKKQRAAKKDLSCRKAKSGGQGRGRQPRGRKAKAGNRKADWRKMWRRIGRTRTYVRYVEETMMMMTMRHRKGGLDVMNGIVDDCTTIGV